MNDELRREYYEDEINLLDFWRVLIKYKKLIASIVGFAFIASVVISFLLPKIYASTARVFVQERERSIVTQWVGFLQSQNLRDAIIEKFDLRALYKAETIEDVRTLLGSNVSIKKSQDGIVTITVEDKVPERAAQMSNAFIEELGKFNREVVMSSGRRMRIFVEKRLDEAQVKLTETEESLKDFQEKNKVIKMDDWSKAIINAIGMAKGQLKAKEVELQTMLPFTTPNNPQVEMLRAEVKALRRRLKELEEGNKVKTSGSEQQEISIPTSKIPDLGLRYARLLRDFRIQDTVFELLTEQYEMARIQEARDSPTVQVLDYGKVPEKRSKPNRKRIVILSVFLSVFFSVFLIFFLELIAWIRETEKSEERGRTIEN